MTTTAKRIAALEQRLNTQSTNKTPPTRHELLQTLSSLSSEQVLALKEPLKGMVEAILFCREVAR